MRLICWSLVAVAGLAIMAWTYSSYMRPDAAAPWSSGVIYLGNGLGDVPRRPIEFKHLPTTACELPPGPIGAALLMALGGQGGDEQKKGGRGGDVQQKGGRGETNARSLAGALCEKLLLLDPKDAGIGEASLESGRLPRAGQDEVLAGFQTTARERLAVAGHDFTVVGFLRRDVALLANCYLVPPHDRVAPVFAADTAIHSAWLVQLTSAQRHDRQSRRKLEEIFPRQQFVAVAPMVRVDRRPFYLYLTGEAVLLLGGSLALIALYGAMARRVRWSVLHDPLAELAARPKLLGALHLVYFGLVLAASAVIYHFPELQMGMLSVVHGAVADPHNPLGVAGKAYDSQNIAWAAAVTFAVNFLLGSAAVITVPSLLVPGSGTLVAVLRATLWGLLLAPSFATLSLVMLPHAGTLLLEGEGYILAAFFGLLVPIYLFERDKGAALTSRYGRALLINLKAMTLVAVVLLAAACYEATEVILMMKYGG
jgi:hypothetical protein